MRPDNAVPDVSLLKRFLLGQLGRADAEPVERYLEQHPEVASTLAELVKDDTLAASLRGAAEQPADPPELAGLMEKLSHLRPGGDDATVGLPAENGDAAAVLAPPQAPDEIGRLGGYRVLKLLGAGGMGMVYQAEDVHLQRPVALKVMKPEVARNLTARERFLREARAAARLRSDYVVNVYQAGEDRQVVFLAMEYLEGLSLDDWLKKGRKPTLAQAVRIGRQIALGLADAHACGLIHRDVKPGNVWLDSTRQGRARLLDFGLARAGADDEHHLTQSGAILGTPAYMAPEQGRGEKVDHRADLFSLGCVLYRLTTGRLPFRGDNTMSVLTSLAVDTPPPPRQLNPDVPPRLAALIERLLAKDREQRPATARAVADELAAVEREVTQPATDEHTMQVRPALSASEPRALASGATAPARARSRLGWLVAASLLLLGGAAAAIVVIVRDRQGNKIAEIPVPPGGDVQIKEDGKAPDEVKGRPAAKEGVAIAAAPLPPLPPGEPLSPTALVRQPAKRPGVRSWTIETSDVGAEWGSHSSQRLSYRPDGKRLALGGRDGSIRIWEPPTGRLVQVLYAPCAVESLAWSPDGRVLAVGPADAEHGVRLWDAESGRLLRALARQKAPVSFLAWSRDGRKVLGAHGEARFVWDAPGGKLLSRFTSPGSIPLAYSADGKYLAGFRPDVPALLVWNAETEQGFHRLAVSKDNVPSASWSPNNKQLVFACNDGVHLWDVEAGKEISHRKDLPRPYWVHWSPDGRSLAAGLEGNQGYFLLGAAEDSKPRALEEPYDGPMTWSPDGTVIARHQPQWGWVRLYDAATGKRLRALSEGTAPLGGFAWSPTGSAFAVNDGPGRILLSSVDTGQAFATLKNSNGPLAWSPDGKHLATAGPNHAVILWNDGGKKRITLTGHEAEVTYLAWSPDGKRLASSSGGEKRVLLWDADKGEQLRELGPFPARAEFLSWSPDGRLLAFNVPQHNWHVWDVEQNRLVNDPQQWAIVRFAFAPDSRSALTLGSNGDDYRLRGLPTFKELAHIPSTPDFFNLGFSTVWSPDGRLLAVQDDADVRLWRGDLARRLRTLRGSLPGINELAFSPDGKVLMGRAYQRLHVWETDTGRLRGIVLLGEKSNGLTITADGHYTGNEDVERGIVLVVQKDDGTQELLEPADFEQKYGWKNEPNKVHLLQPLPPSLYPLPGMPMGPLALVREPAELPDVNSWTVETVNPRGEVRAVAYRPDGKLLATGGYDGTIRLWDTSSGKLVRMLVGDPVQSLWWSEDGKVLTALRPGDVQGNEWDADTGRLLRRVIGAVTPETRTARSPDGRQTVTADDKGVRITDTATGKVLHTLEEIGQVRYHGLSWSPDGRELALAYQFPGESGLRVVEAATERPLPLPGDYERAGAWSPDGKTFAAIGHDSRVHLLNGAAYRALRTLEGTIGGTALSWSADGKHLAGSAPEGVQVWSVESGKQRWKSDKPAHNSVWSPDGTKLASNDANPNGRARIYRAETGELLREVSLQSSVLSWSPDGKFLVAGLQDSNEARVIEADSGAVKSRLKDGVFRLRWVRWSSDGKTFTTLSAHGLLRVWDAATGEAGRTTQLSGVTGIIGGMSLAAWSSDGQVLAWASGGTIHLHDAAGGPLGVLMPLGPYAQLAVTADGRYRGSARVERAIRMVVQKRDGTSETLTPREFEQKYNFKNDPAAVQLFGD